MSHQVIASDIQQFIDAFRALAGGEIAEETAQKLQECVKATMIEGKGSTLTISMGIKRTSEETIIIEGEVKAKIPQPKKSSAYFVNLQTFLPSRNRPEQQVLPGV